MSRRHLRTAKRVFARAVVFCAAVMYFVMVSGMAIPTSESIDWSEPFPCMHCRCGCKTARQCWTNCCCHSLQERLAWAKANGIKPPSYVVIPKEVSIAEKKPAKCRHCCAARHVSDKSLLAERTRQATTCKTGAASRVALSLGNTPDHPRPPAVPPKTVPGSVIFLRAMECHGQSLTWMSLAWVTLPNVVHVETPPSWSEDLPIRDCSRTTVFYRPPLKPPRV